MQAVFLALAASCVPLAVRASAEPIGKVLSMLSDLEAQIIKEGEVVQKEYAAFAEWCEDRSRNLGFEIKTGNGEVESLKASIAEETATASSLSSKVDELVAAIASNDKDAAAATAIRTKEAADFAAEEKELKETINMLERATGILQRQMNGGASMMQLRSAGSLVEAFNIMVQASLIGTGDAAKLSAFLQDSQRAQDAEDDQDPGAPAGAVYQSQSGDIVDTLQDLTEKAAAQLADTRQKEVAARHNYDMLSQSLDAEIKYATNDLDGTKKGIAGSTEKKAAAAGDLGVTAKELAEDEKTKGTLHQTCLLKASNFAAETQSRGEELKALADAKKIISEATGGAALDQLSFIQFARTALTSSTDLHRYEAVRLVRDLAHKQHSSALAQLASRMTAAMHSGDAFEKVKGLISDMISKLEAEAGADATKKAFCDKELAETTEKKADKSDEIGKLSIKIDQMSARSAQLKEEVATLQSDLSTLASAQAGLGQFRQEDNTAYVESKAVLEKGLTGIKAALTILNEYYGADGKAHGAAEGAASGITSLLEVVEANLAKNLAQINADEDSAASEFEKVSKENEIDRATKEQGVEYKLREATQLDKTSAELSSDRTGVQAELDAILEYLSKLQAECIAKAETYGARKESREAEIAGLKEALRILVSETALVQRHVARKTLRGASSFELSAIA